MSKIFKIGAKNLISTFFWTVLISAVFVFPVYAENVIKFDNPSSSTNITDLATKVTNWFLSITPGLAILFLIIGGIYYLTAFGDDKRLEEGKKIISYTVFGLIIILISYSVVLTVNKIIFG